MDVDRIAEVFKDQVLFITGATGFMGKVFLERLLRVTEVRKIFILIRPKRNKNSEERLIELFANPLFDQLKSIKSMSEILEKVIVIAGDCSYKDLNISPADRAAIVSQVSMIYHFAATVKFNEKFKRAIELNVRGTREMVKIAFDCSNLIVFCHVSTAYSHLHEKHLLEKVYDAPADPHEIIEIAEKYNEEKVEKLMSNFLNKFVPNSYVFTKALSESLVSNAYETHNLPLLLCRPAVVIPMMKEPIPGWTDNLNNISGIVAASGLGVLRTIMLTEETELNLIPVDYSTSNIMVATWDYLTHHKSTLRVVNLEYEGIKVLEGWPVYEDAFRNLYPFEISLWFPNLSFPKNFLLYCIQYFFYQTIPALLVDGLLKLIGKKPILRRANQKINKEINAVRIFMDNKWSFEQENVRIANKLLNDLEITKYGTLQRDRVNFIKKSVLGIRKYVFKQDDKTIERSKKRIKLVFFIDRCIKLTFFVGLVYFLTNLFMR
ncbi:hypothetical protein PVAND_016766 [Polypedilum vanderplanki]|uniref:Fatty acyl-CoA reductase n=1 Tax=Polypedilum vanderplanki TaxID=319348 RepID=A0A9J6BG44_POLVA|nr:hypothetical protein PVAND_016766 [Polypedilum vanderplanki]